MISSLVAPNTSTQISLRFTFRHWWDHKWCLLPSALFRPSSAFQPQTTVSVPPPSPSIRSPKAASWAWLCHSMTPSTTWTPWGRHPVDWPQSTLLKEWSLSVCLTPAYILTDMLNIHVQSSLTPASEVHSDLFAYILLNKEKQFDAHANVNLVSPMSHLNSYSYTLDSPVTTVNGNSSPRLNEEEIEVSVTNTSVVAPLCS